MKRTLIVTSLAIVIAAGCATRNDNRLAWEVQAANEVRHGMAEAAAQYQLGRVFQSQGRWDAAEVAFGRAAAADPRNADALAALGVIYAERGELSRSTETFRRVLALSPDKAYLHNNVGYALHLEGKHVEAIEALRTAVTLDPAYERAWVNLRKAAERAGQTELAQLAAQRRLVPPLAAETAPEGVMPTVAATSTSTAPAPEAVPPAVVPASTLAALSSPPAEPVSLPRLPEPVQAPVASQPAITLTEVPYQQTAVRDAGQVPPAAPEAPAAAKPAPRATMVKGRVELANANGMPRFATRLGKLLRKDGIKVSRIINHGSFTLKKSVIEYRVKSADSALALRDRLGLKVALKRVPDTEVQSDLRVVLGRDSLPYLASLPAPANGKAPVRLARNDSVQRPRSKRG